MTTQETGQAVLKLVQDLEATKQLSTMQRQILIILRPKLAMFNLNSKGESTIKKGVMPAPKVQPTLSEVEEEEQAEPTALLADNSARGLDEIAKTKRKRKNKDADGNNQ